jgi:hypothetical protein
MPAIKTMSIPNGPVAPPAPPAGFQDAANRAERDLALRQARTYRPDVSIRYIGRICRIDTRRYPKQPDEARARRGAGDG